MVNALKALCKYQFDHGARPHQSKEFLIMNGLYQKPISKKNLNKYTKDTKIVSSENFVKNSEFLDEKNESNTIKNKIET